MTTTTPTRELTDVEVDTLVRAYRALTDKSTASAEVRAGVAAYRKRLRERSGQTPRATRTRKELAADVADTVAQDVAPRADTVTADARALSALLADFKGVISRRPTLPVLTGVKLATIGDQLFVVGTDLERILESRMTVGDNQAELSVVAPYGALAEAVKAAVPRSKKADAAVVLRHDPDAGTLAVEAGTMARTLRLLDREDFPSLGVGLDSGAARKVDGPSFAAAALAAYRSASDDEARPILAGALLRVWTDKTVNPGTDPDVSAYDHVGWVSTDSYRLTVRNLPLKRGGSQPGFAKVIDRASVKLIAGMFKATPTVLLAAENGWVLVADQTRSLYMRAVEGDFPNWERLVPDAADPSANYDLLTVDRQTLADTLAGFPTTKGANPIRLTLHPDTLEVSYHEQDVADATATLPATWTGEDGLIIQFNPRYLADALLNLDGPVQVWIKDGLKPAVLTSDDTDGLYLLMPIRLP